MERWQSLLPVLALILGAGAAWGARGVLVDDSRARIVALEDQSKALYQLRAAVDANTRALDQASIRLEKLADLAVKVPLLEQRIGSLEAKK